MNLNKRLEGTPIKTSVNAGSEDVYRVGSVAGHAVLFRLSVMAYNLNDAALWTVIGIVLPGTSLAQVTKDGGSAGTAAWSVTAVNVGGARIIRCAGAIGVNVRFEADGVLNLREG